MFLGTVRAQDIHFSQFFNSPLNTNPALTGIFNGDIRLGAHFRQQWENVPVDYLTFSGYADKKFYNPRNETGFFSGGILFNYDRAGDSRLSMIQGALSGSYTLMLNKRNLVTLGVQAGASNTRVDFSQDLQWGSQFNGLMFSPESPNGEPFEGVQTLTYFDMGGGLNYRWQTSERTHIDIGAGLYNILTPDQAFYDGKSDLPMRISGNLDASFQLSRALDLQFHGLAQFQQDYREYVPAINLRIHVNQKRGTQFALDLGGIGRLNNNELDAWTPYLALNFNQWRLGLNYDFNASEFKVASDRQGGPEVSLTYIIKRVKQPEVFKNCPIF